MGNKPSQPVEYAVGDEELRHAPHNFYLVFGKPSLQFARDRVRGPLIYDVEVEYDEDRDAVEHTATLDLTSAVPRRQQFELVAAASPPSTSTQAAHGTPARSQSGGLALTFRVATTAPPRRVRVLTNVGVEYRPGHGLRLVSGESAANSPHCIFTTTATEELTTVVTRPEIVPARLRPVAFEDAPHAASVNTTQRISYAPLVIEVDVGEAEDPIRASERSSGATATATASAAATPTIAAASGVKSEACAAAPSTPSPPSRKHIWQYTLLEVPLEAAEAALRDVDAERARLVCKVSKQLLQVGCEVYELEDVFDVGRDEEPLNPLGEQDDEEEDVCLVCFTNPKDTTILPCRHMCLCSECATQLRLSNNRCPLCRGNIDRLMTF